MNTRPAPPALPAERWVHTASVEIVVGPASAVSVRTGTIHAAESGLFGYFCKKPKYGLIGTAAGYCSFSTPLYISIRDHSELENARTKYATVWDITSDHICNC